MHPSEFVYEYSRTSAGAEAAPAAPTGALVWHLRGGSLDAKGCYPKVEVYDSVLLLSSVTTTYEMAYWNPSNFGGAWVIFSTGTLTASVPLTLPFPYEASYIYVRRVSAGANGVLYCQPKQASTTLTASSTSTLSTVVKAEDSAHVSGENGIATWRVRRDAPGTSGSADGDYVTPNQDADGYDYVRVKGYDSATDSNKGFEVSPLDSHFAGMDLSVTAAVAGGTVKTDYLDVAGVGSLSIQFKALVGSYSKTLQVYASLRDDGTAPSGFAAGDWFDVGNAWFGAASWTSATLLERDTPMCIKWVRLEVTVGAGATVDNTWDLLARKKGT